CAGRFRHWLYSWIFELEWFCCRFPRLRWKLLGLDYVDGFLLRLCRLSGNGRRLCLDGWVGGRFSGPLRLCQRLCSLCWHCYGRGRQHSDYRWLVDFERFGHGIDRLYGIMYGFVDVERISYRQSTDATSSGAGA
ncbi:MAG TPA: hypothetical protein VIG24_12705, partial [Acidimicrobiia bacterium]